MKKKMKLTARRPDVLVTGQNQTLLKRYDVPAGTVTAVIVSWWNLPRRGSERLDKWQRASRNSSWSRH